MDSGTHGLWSVERAKAAIDVEDLDVLKEWLKEAKLSTAVLDDLLLHAANEEKDDLFSFFLDAGASSQKFLDIRSRPPLFTVLRKHHGSVENLQLILDLARDNKIKNYVNSKDRKGYTALYVAAKNGHMDCTKLLISSGSKVNAPSGYDRYMPLMAASARGHLDIVKIIIEAGAVINKETTLGDNALCYAARSSHSGCIRQLLQSGAHVNSATKCGETALMTAAKTNDKDTLNTVKELVAAGANVALKDWRLQTALWYAANYSSEAVALFLAGRLNDISAVNVDSSLLAAVTRDHESLLRLLLEHGWQINCRDKYGRGILHVGSEGRSINCLRFILQTPALRDNLNINECAGRFLALSPLHLAICWSHPEVVELLLAAGADPNLCDPQRATALVACMSTIELRSRAASAKLILRHGCNIEADVMAKRVQPGSVEELQSREQLQPALAWALSLRELWFAKMLWTVGARAGRVAGWTDVSLPWQQKLVYPEDEYTPAASRADVLEFIKDVICQPRSLEQCCCAVIRRVLHNPLYRSIQHLPLPPHVLRYLNVPELEEIEEDNAKEDQQQRERSYESDDDFDVGSTTSESDDSD